LSHLEGRSQYSSPYVFEPTAGVRVALTTSDTDGALISGQGPNVLISNDSTTIWAYVNFGADGTVDALATTAMVAVEPGKTVPFTLPVVAGVVYQYFSAVTSTGSTNIHISRGYGG
jgi:hypothetical protein